MSEVLRGFKIVYHCDVNGKYYSMLNCRPDKIPDQLERAEWIEYKIGQFVKPKMDAGPLFCFSHITSVAAEYSMPFPKGNHELWEIEYTISNRVPYCPHVSKWPSHFIFAESIKLVRFYNE